ncbi:MULTISPECIES: YHYH protein [unclassified Streptomyces]|uniref:YHYH protein n=1 Tax=unclassified Streptomyces TaxID=2593676 RepID=UPI0019065E9A|nr:YHYH protein [Streptomyces sp. HSG2]
MSQDQTRTSGPSSPSRRIVLLGGLAAALGVSACGRTTVTGVAHSSATGEVPQVSETVPESTELTGDYSIVDPTTGTEIDVVVADGIRSIRANGLPNHETGEFPNPGNPNSISAQSYEFELPVAGEVAAEPTPLLLPQPFGIAVNGVLFDPLAAEWYRGDRQSGWTVEAISPTASLGLDDNHAHVQPTGAYHYHGMPTGLVGNLDPSAHSPLLGWAGDGFPVYARYGYTDPQDPESGISDLTPSYRLRSGTRSGGPGGRYDGTYTEDFEYVEGHGKLDLANGRQGVTPEYPDGTYYYVLTESFPFIPRHVVGTMADSFVVSGGPR